MYIFQVIQDSHFWGTAAVSGLLRRSSKKALGLGGSILAAGGRGRTRTRKLQAVWGVGYPFLGILIMISFYKSIQKAGSLGSEGKMDRWLRDQLGFRGKEAGRVFTW